MEPEIARRCKSCGAAIRPRSAFCPQCGEAVAEGGTAEAEMLLPAAAPEQPQPAPTDYRPQADTGAPPLAAPPSQAVVATEQPSQTKAPSQAEAPAPVDARERDAAAAVVAPVESASRAGALAAGAPGGAAPAPTPAAPEKQQRVSALGREAFDESARPRGEKLRRASTVVLDEAAADPSLRFVLVATALIILSLLLLLLGRIL